MKRIKFVVLIVLVLISSSLMSACTPEELEEVEIYLWLLEEMLSEGDMFFGIRVKDGTGNILMQVEESFLNIESEDDLWMLFDPLYQVTPTCDPIYVEFYLPAIPELNEPEIVLLTEFEDTGYFGPCPAAPNAPGADMVPMPDTAVVGKFLAQTPLYFAPLPGATSNEYMMGPGQSLYVFGVDETGAFYKVLMSGQFFWVPVETMGPCYDPPWNGWPLPTEVVK